MSLIPEVMLHESRSRLPLGRTANRAARRKYLLTELRKLRDVNLTQSRRSLVQR